MPARSNQVREGRKKAGRYQEKIRALLREAEAAEERGENGRARELRSAARALDTELDALHARMGPKGLAKPEEILEGLRRIARGKVVFGSAVQARLRTTNPGQAIELKPAPTKLDALSPREQQILRMIGRGLGRAEIAREACISPKTVDNHRESIMTKLDIHDRAQLVRFSLAEGVAEL